MSFPSLSALPGQACIRGSAYLRSFAPQTSSCFFLSLFLVFCNYLSPILLPKRVRKPQRHHMVSHHVPVHCLGPEEWGQVWAGSPKAAVVLSCFCPSEYASWWPQRHMTLSGPRFPTGRMNGSLPPPPFLSIGCGEKSTTLGF